ncbi:MAG TPA: alanine--tRNA ligase [Pirellulaceae bacterium]|nr:alanine--tRNA ligase [Pirellulaceae bacterium]
MKTDELREKYLEFFAGKGHTRKDSDVLVPRWDPSVLFTPAGMNQFKDHFLGRVKLDFTRATTCQKCLRTGDIDNVGRTAYHHTFFEMLGNFSFGDYFKQEAIEWAWEFLTSPKWLGIPKDQLTVTVYLDDDEAFGIWNEKIGLPASRIQRCGEDENFWPASAPSQGPDGVCGPCSEIYYHPPGKKEVEIWNLVFTQFNRVGLPPDNLRPLPSKNIDTGMGLERCASMLQGVDTNYHIDILRPLVEAAANAAGTTYDPASDEGRRCRRIADHVRACTFAIHENVLPGPEKENYVIRRLLRRATLDGYQMGRREPFLFELVGDVVQAMKVPYPELAQTADRVAKQIKLEEGAYFNRLGDWMGRIEKLLDAKSAKGSAVVGGEDSGQLLTTYGIHPELLETVASERGLAFDWKSHKEWMETHGEISGSGQKALFNEGPIESLKKALGTTPFLGYDGTSADATVKGIVFEDKLREDLSASAAVEGGQAKLVGIALDKTPFYAEAGGQVADTGSLTAGDMKCDVVDVQKKGDLYVHFGYLRSGTLKVGEKVHAEANPERRDAIRRAHSATHLLQHALQQELGTEVHQQGSKVEPDQLRFDFSFGQGVPAEELTQIEERMKARIAEDAAVSARVMPLGEARLLGAMMLFGEKYPDPVRVVFMGDWSKEFCGGTHLDNLGQIGTVEILSEESVSAGTRRIVALTGRKAAEHAERTMQTLHDAAAILGVADSQVREAAAALAREVRDLKKELSGGPKTAPAEALSPASGAELQYAEARSILRDVSRTLNVPPFETPQRLQAMLEERKRLQAQLAELSQSGDISSDSMLAQAERIGSTAVVVAETPGANPNLMRQWIDQLRKKAGSSATLFAAKQGDDKVVVIAALSDDLVKRGLKAGDWVKPVAETVGGSGGGKPDLAQAGGKSPEKLSEALDIARSKIRSLLS